MSSLWDLGMYWSKADICREAADKKAAQERYKQMHAQGEFSSAVLSTLSRARAD